MSPQWLQAPSGFPEFAQYVAWFRYALLGLVILWSFAALRARRDWPVLLAGLAFVGTAAGFWVASLGRPYGLLADPDATLRAGEAAVADVSRDFEQSMVVGQPARSRVLMALVRGGVPAETLTLVGSALPMVVVAALGLLVSALWARRETATLAAVLLWAFGTGDLDASRGVGLLSGLWLHPESGMVLPFLVAATLLAGRLPASVGSVAAFVLTATVGLLPSAEPRLPALEAVWIVTLYQGIWLILGFAGLRRARDNAAAGLIAGGLLVLLLAVFRPGIDAFGAHALYRLGLLLASAEALAPQLERIGERAKARWPRLAAVDPRRLGVAVLLAAFVPGSFASWWDPSRGDDVYRASLERISPAIANVMLFLRDQTPKDAVVLASPDYAPAVAVFAGRRVLRAPSISRPGDDERRERQEGAILSGRPLPPAASRYPVGFVLIAPGDFRARGIQRPEDLDGRSGLALRYSDADGYRVYEVVR